MPLCRFVLGTLAVLAVVLSTSCSQPSAEGVSSSESHKLKIKYFYSVDGDRGYASIEAGVEAAIADSGDDEFNFRKYVELTGESDEDSPERAEESARKIRQDPDVLGVIGHPTSATTYAAMPFYADAGIPVIVPSATSPDVMIRHPAGARARHLSRLDDTSPRFSNAVRLSPSDVPDQARTMALTIKTLWKPDDSQKKKRARVLLICEDTEETGAYVYSRPICDHLNRKETRALGGNYDVVDTATLDKRSLETILPVIRATKPHFIVVAGYPLLARLVLQVWNEDHQKSPATKAPLPMFIMSDACRSPEVGELVDSMTSGAKVYITYPVAPDSVAHECAQRGKFLEEINMQAQCQVMLRHSRCEEHDEAQLKAKNADLKAKDIETDFEIPNKVPETAETFAYDAVLIFKAAVKACVGDNDLNRRCIRQYLEDHHADLRGLCQTYHVERGDRVNAHYFVYYADPKLKGPREWPTLGSANNDDYELDTNSGRE